MVIWEFYNNTDFDVSPHHSSHWNCFWSVLLVVCHHFRFHFNQHFTHAFFSPYTKWCSGNGFKISSTLCFNLTCALWDVSVFSVQLLRRLFCRTVFYFRSCFLSDQQPGTEVLRQIPTLRSHSRGSGWREGVHTSDEITTGHYTRPSSSSSEALLLGEKKNA